MKKRYSLYFFLFACSALWGQDFTLRIMHNNDGESRIVPDTIDGRVVGGAAPFKFVVDSLREEGTPNILLSSGDNFLAGPAFQASLALPAGEPYYDAIVLDSLAYDAIALGNHDFDFGPDTLVRFINSFDVNQPPYLSANLDFTEEPRLDSLLQAGRIQPSTTLEVDGEEIGVVSLITPELATVSSPRNTVVKENILEIAQQQVDDLTAAGVNKIILISHLQSINNEIDLATELTDVDVIIAGGGDELLTNDPDQTLGEEVFGSYPLDTLDADGEPVYIVTTPGNYRYVGNLTVEFDADGKVTAIDEGSDLILVADRTPDPWIEENIVSEITAFNAVLAANIIATTEVALDGTRGGVRTRETNQGNLIADAFLWLGERERSNLGLDPDIPIIGMQGGGGIRNDNVIPAGSDISELTTFEMLPFTNFTSVTNPVSADTLKMMLENGVSRVEDVSGRFQQVAGIKFVWDTTGLPDFTRIRSAMLSDGTPLVEDYMVVEDAPQVYIVTNSFQAGGGDGFDEFPAVGFQNLSITYQRALFEYINSLGGTIAAADYPEGGEGRILETGTPEGTPDSDKVFDLEVLGSYSTGIFDEGAAEILAHDPGTQRVFFTNADANTVEVLDIANPSTPVLINTLLLDDYGDGVNSVDIANGIAAVAVQAEEADDPGRVVFFDMDGTYLNDVEVGALPDMLIYTSDGTKVLVANEGEPNEDYNIDPPGTVSIVDIGGGVENATVTTLGFESLAADSATLVAAGLRIFGPNASFAQDLEPEYIAITEDDATAYVVLQENNGVAVVDLSVPEITAIVPLGVKNHFLSQNGLDASNRTDEVDIRPWPVYGMYQPDAITAYRQNGMDYLVTVNEGDARDYDGFSEETRVEDLTLDPSILEAFPDLQEEDQMGRLRTTDATGDDDGDGDIDRIHAYGGRSFSIWSATGELLFDSGNDLELRTLAAFPDDFNSTNSENQSFKNRSDDKGPEPEAVDIVKSGEDIFALIGLERIGGIIVYDITDPTAPEFVNYVNNRDFSIPLTEDDPSRLDEVGDLGVEDVVFVPIAESPTDNALVLTANEVSGTVTIFTASGDVTSIPEIDEELAGTFNVFPNPTRGPIQVNYDLPEGGQVQMVLFDGMGRYIRDVMAATDLPAGPQQYAFSLKALPAGTYYLMARVNDRAVTLPIIRQ